MNSKFLAAFLIIALVLIAGCSQQKQDIGTKKRIVGGALPASPLVVKDQTVKDGTVAIEKATSSGPGWISIRVQSDGAPGPSIGYAALTDGENKNIVVKIDATKATATLYAVLHKDKGQAGVFEYPGPDTAVSSSDIVGEIVAPSFKATK